MAVAKKTKAQATDIKKELNAGTKRTKNILQSYKTGTLLTLNIDQIDFYDKNPRITKNEKYDEVYVSIEAKGLEGTLSVSQRPDNADPQKFLLFRGGNTRLAVLKELYLKTNDKKYFEVNALFQEWISESDTLIGHLTENDSRGDYVFIDRALGVRESKLELEKELAEKISDKALRRILTEQGYKLGIADLTRMNYAVDIMHPHCPKLLASGIGPFQLDAIKKLNVKAAELCLEIDPDKKPEFFTQQFASALAKLEDEFVQDNEANPYNYHALYYAVLKILSNEERITANRLEFFLDNRINAKADQQQAFDPDFVEADDQSIVDVTKQSKPKDSETGVTTSDVKTTNDDVPEIMTDSPTDDESALEIGSHQQESDINLSDSGETTPSPLSSNASALEKAAALHPVSLDYSVTISSDEHDRRNPWDPTKPLDPDFTYLDNLPISCGDRRVLAPLPNKISELRYIMAQKAAIFIQYLKIPAIIVPMDDGVGFLLTNIPPFEDWIQTSETFKDDDPRNYNPLVGFMDKPLHGWWLLLGFSHIMVLAHKSIDFALQLMPSGTLRDYLKENHKITQHEKLIFEHRIQFGHTYDLVNLFLTRATPKELQIFIELQLVFNKINTVMKGDIWGLNHV